MLELGGGDAAMDLAPRRFADTVVLDPVGRINHGGSDELTSALEPFLGRRRRSSGMVEIEMDPQSNG